MSINSLARDVYQTALNNGWYESEPSFSDIVVMCHAELSEAMQAYRCHGDPTSPDVHAEMVDALMRIISHLARHGVDIEQSVINKNQQNKGRGYRHGGKAL